VSLTTLRQNTADTVLAGILGAELAARVQGTPFETSLDEFAIDAWPFLPSVQLLLTGSAEQVKELLEDGFDDSDFDLSSEQLATIAPHAHKTWK